MTKKKFTDGGNPALQFISTPQEEIKVQQIQETKTTEPTTATPEGYKLNPMYVETKSKRVQLVFQPSVYDKAKKEADRHGLSFNEYIHKLINDNI